MNATNQAIREAIQGAGGPSKVARECGVSAQAVCFWRDGLRALPAEHCITLEKMNEGRIQCEQMLPDVDWHYLRTTATPQSPTNKTSEKEA